MFQKLIYKLHLSSYPPNIQCNVTYKVRPSCRKMRFSCSVDLPNKDKRRCRKGDKLVVGKKT